MQNKNIFNIELFNEIEKVTFRDGLLYYNRTRLVIPTKLRIFIMHYLHTNPIAYHKNARVLINEIKRRFWWPGFRMDAEFYIKQCQCNLAKINNKQLTGFKIFYEAVYLCLKPNEIVFMDLHGPMADDNYIILLVDGFDGYTVIDALEPVYGIDSIGVIKFVLYRWCYVYGFMNQVINDNGSNLISKLNKLNNYLFNIKSKNIFASLPWVDGKAEARMKSISRAVLIDQSHRVLLGIEDIFDALDNVRSRGNYRDLLPAIMASQNGSVQRGTKLSPNELRIMSSCPTLLDLNLKLAGINRIKHDEYIKDNVINYKQYSRLVKKHLKMIRYMAQKKKLSASLSKIHKNDVQDLENERIYKDDYVILKTKYKGKHKLNYHYGWVVIKVYQTENQLKPNYLIKNIFTGEELKVNKGRITRFHKPLIDPVLTVQDEVTRMKNMDNHND